MSTDLTGRFSTSRPGFGEDVDAAPHLTDVRCIVIGGQGLARILSKFATGTGIGWGVASLLVYQHAMLVDLIKGSSQPVLPIGMLLFAFGGLFGIAYLATALTPEDGAPRKGRSPIKDRYRKWR